MTASTTTGGSAVDRRPRRHTAGQFVDRTGAALLPGIRRKPRRAHQALQRPGPRPADVRAARAGAHPKALELVKALRDADAVVVGSPGYHGAISGLVKNALDYIEDLREDPRVYLDNTPWGCISCAYGWQAAVGTLGQLR